jgi:type IV secretion system protein VirB10
MRIRFAVASLYAGMCCAAFAQQDNPAQSAGEQDGFKSRTEKQTLPGSYEIAAGTHVLLSMINSVSTKQAAVGDRIYLETAFPVLSGDRIVIPQGSWVTGTITEVKRPGRVKGRGSLQVRFDSLTLPNGVSRNFRSDLGAIDSRDNQTLKREESKIGSAGDKKGDLGTVIGSTAAGTVIGSGVGAAAGNAGKGAGIGTGVGAAAGLVGVLLSRGPDATLTKGSTVEMVLDRPLTFDRKELDFNNAPSHASVSDGGPHQQPARSGWTQHSPF